MFKETTPSYTSYKPYLATDDEERNQKPHESIIENVFDRPLPIYEVSIMLRNAIIYH